MPSSFVDPFPAIVKLLIELAPRRVIDIGPGWGKYGLACREYLPSLEYLAAIEVPEGRLPTQDVIYDDIVVLDARTATAEQFQGCDLALLIDVIEHMRIDEGHKLLATIQAAKCEILVSTPKIFTPQHDHANPYEEHLSLWSWDLLSRHGIKRDISTIDSIIYLLQAPMLTTPRA